MAHTLGPWKAVRSDPAEGFDVWWIEGNDSGNNRKNIADVPGGHDPANQANAALISAAPDLLAAAKEALKRIRNIGGEDAALVFAIAKAEGK